MYLGLNPGICFSKSGFRPTVDYLMFLGLSCGFKPRVDLFEVYGSEPRDNLTRPNVYRCDRVSVEVVED